MKDTFPIYDICAISEFKRDDILISRFAPYLKSHKNLALPHKHTFYHVVLFTEGGGTHEVDFTTFAVKPFQIYFMVPGQVHSWSFEGEVDGYIINFSVPFFQSFLLRPDYLEEFPFFNGTTDHSVIDIPHPLQSQITQLFEAIIHESEINEKAGLDMVKALMLQIFILVSRLSTGSKSQNATSYNYTLLKSFQKLVEKSFSELKLPKDYAEILYITPNHLNAICKDMLGVPAGEVIRNRVILEAKRLLINRDQSVTSIAYGLNFADNSYFTKFFKKHTGLTPEDFRKQTLTHTHHDSTTYR
ncbi:AraC family transcriptional regulator [Mucilaginibacter paludis]|uniref:Transcriptional regulator, AraC family n=1 Tax=Mucilaginibacter paludis DSM 18603 TaxID=714943 RepID=H1YH43_9SPHI|nr:helix-turn-helix transcriptional regulator [Mucilaginibacter paludis]EHQ24545.1 transcriptional regulator, AraC family [Mucilaginibacter paludis DSM 18603]